KPLQVTIPSSVLQRSRYQVILCSSRVRDSAAPGRNMASAAEAAVALHHIRHGWKPCPSKFWLRPGLEQSWGFPQDLFIWIGEDEGGGIGVRRCTVGAADFGAADGGGVAIAI